jgi:hypothetical protein
MIAKKPNDETDLTFMVKFLSNEVTGCQIDDVKLFDGIDDSAKQIENI